MSQVKLLPVNGRTSMQHVLLLVEDLPSICLNLSSSIAVNNSEGSRNARSRARNSDRNDSYRAHEVVSNNGVDRNTYDTCNTRSLGWRRATSERDEKNNEIKSQTWSASSSESQCELQCNNGWQSRWALGNRSNAAMCVCSVSVRVKGAVEHKVSMTKTRGNNLIK